MLAKTPFLRLVAQLLVFTLVFGLIPAPPAQASIPAPERTLPLPLPLPPPALPLAESVTPVLVAAVVAGAGHEEAAACAVVLLLSDPQLPSKYHRARWMDATVGRFVGMDPFNGVAHDPSTLHKYLYVGSDPANSVDPTGLSDFSLSGALSALGNLTTIAARAVGPALRAIQPVTRFFWNNRAFSQISRAYWRKFGPAAGRSLHHWLFPQSAKWIPQGLRNAGFNLIELPHLLPGTLGLNQWMGFAVRWGGYRAVMAGFVENGIRWGIPLILYAAREVGEEAGEAIRDFSLDDLDQELSDDQDANLLDP